MAKKKAETEQMALIEANDVSSNIDIEEIKEEIKVELKEYLNNYNEKRFLEELDKSNRRLIKEKNHKIIFRDIIIFLLICFIIGGSYVLYHKKVFDFLLNRNRAVEVIEKKDSIKQEEKKEQVVEEKEISQEDLKKKYGYLLDKYNLGIKSRYLKDFYDGKLTSEIKKEMVLNNVFEKIVIDEEDYSSIDENDFSLAFSKLFNDDYNRNGFIYNNNKIRFISKFNQYISESLLKKDIMIDKEIVDIKEEGKQILIRTNENVNNEEIIMTYIFENEKLINLKTS